MDDGVDLCPHLVLIKYSLIAPLYVLLVTDIFELKNQSTFSHYQHIFLLEKKALQNSPLNEPLRRWLELEP